MTPAPGSRGRRRVRLGCLCLSAALAAGCGGPPPAASTPSAGPSLPSADTLAAIAAEPAPPGRLDMYAALVDDWDLVGPFPELGSTAAPPDPADPWAQALARHLAGQPGVEASLQMRCLAREVGHFALLNGARPAPGLLEFMASRCGSTAVRLTAGFLAFEDDGAPPETQYRARADKVEALFEPIDEGPREAGVWFGSVDGTAVVAVTTGERWVELDQAGRSPGPDGAVVLRGRFVRPAAQARAMVATGSYGARACALDPATPWPAFTITCRPDPADDVAWLEVATFIPGRALGRRALDLLLWPAGRPPARYRRPHAGPPVAVADVPDLTRAFLDEVNRVRGRAGHPPLDLAPAQSRTVAALAPHFFDALHDRDRRERLDTIALGLIAGWDVPGTVHHGQLGSTMVPRADVAALVAAVLEGPFGRSVLCDPTAHYLAVGPRYEPTTRTLAALFGTYAAVERVDREAVAAAVWERLMAARQKRGPRPPLRRLGGVRSALDDAIARIDAGRAHPDEALGHAIIDAGMRVGRRVRGFTIMASAPDEIELPDELLEPLDVAVALAVTVYVPARNTPGQYVILVLASP